MIWCRPNETTGSIYVANISYDYTCITKCLDVKSKVCW